MGKDIAEINDNYWKTMCRNLKLLRLEAGLSVKEMAIIAEMDEKLLKRLERGEQVEEFDINQFLNYCLYFDVQPKCIFDDWPIKRGNPK